MSDLRDLYQEVLLDHYKRPRNFGELQAANRHAEGSNPLCGDELALDLVVADGRLQEIAFRGQGCAISTASASLMTEAVKGKTQAEAEALFAKFHDLLTGDPSVEARAGEDLGKLAVFAGVREYPVRVKCATLAWHTLNAALQGAPQPVTTES